MASCGVRWDGGGSGTGRDRSWGEGEHHHRQTAAAAAVDVLDVAFPKLVLPCDSDDDGGDDGQQDPDGVRSYQAVTAAFDRRAYSDGCGWCGSSAVDRLEDRC